MQAPVSRRELWQQGLHTRDVIGYCVQRLRQRSRSPVLSRLCMCGQVAGSGVKAMWDLISKFVTSCATMTFKPQRHDGEVTDGDDTLWAAGWQKRYSAFMRSQVVLGVKCAHFTHERRKLSFPQYLCLRRCWSAQRWCTFCRVISCWRSSTGLRLQQRDARCVRCAGLRAISQCFLEHTDVIHEFFPGGLCITNAFLRSPPTPGLHQGC